MKNAVKALREYGYIVSEGMWVKKDKPTRTQSWKSVEGGFHRFDPDNGAWIQIPYKLLPEFDSHQKDGVWIPGVAGLDYKRAEHKDCFDWVWPADYVANMYVEATKSQQAYAEMRAKQKNESPPEPVVIDISDVVDEVITVPKKKHWWSKI